MPAKQKVTLGELQDAMAQERDEFARRLVEGEVVEGVLLGASFYGSPHVFLRDADGGTFVLNGHASLIRQLRPFAIGSSVVIEVTKKGGSGRPYAYEVHLVERLESPR